MKKYILKIAGLTTTTTALVTTIACSDKPEPKKQEKISLESLLTQLKDVESTQTKSQITTILGDKKTKNTFLDATILKKIGFTPPPSISKEGVTTTYNLEQTWTTSSTELKIKVTLKKNGQDSKSKTIIITPKVISFNAEEAKFVSQPSDKTKAQISAVLNGKGKDLVLTPNILGLIGFKEPSNLEPTFKPTYTLEELWIDSSTKVQVKVILEKSGEKSSGKIFAILPKGEVQVTNIFEDELKKWEALKIQFSQKTLAEVSSILKGKNKDATLVSSVLTSIGFEMPSNLDTTSFTYHYTLEEALDISTTSVKIKVKLEKNGKKSLGVILTMNTKNINFHPELDKFSSPYTSTTKTKTEIIDKLSEKSLGVNSNLVDLTDVGYSPTPSFDSSFTATYKLTKVPSDTDPKVTIQVTLTKQLMTDTKVIIITPMTIDFSDELSKFVNKTSSKTKKEIIEALGRKPVNYNLTDLTDAGYSPTPSFDSSFTATYKLTKVPSDTDPKVTIQVTLTKQLMTATKEITITPMTIDFSDELVKFSAELVKFADKKTEVEISELIKELDGSKTKGDILDDETLSFIGYTKPNLNPEFSVKYKLKEP